MSEKRVSFKCGDDVFDKLESLKALLGAKRDDILTEAINDRFKDVIANIALKEGLLEKSPEIVLNRSNFATAKQTSSFDEICDALGLKGDDGHTASVQKIKLEIKNASIEK